jgi:hypothetical protein
VLRLWRAMGATDTSPVKRARRYGTRFDMFLASKQRGDPGQAYPRQLIVGRSPQQLAVVTSLLRSSGATRGYSNVASMPKLA